MMRVVEMILAVLAGLIFWGCIASAILIICVGEPFVDAMTQLAWSLK